MKIVRLLFLLMFFCVGVVQAQVVFSDVSIIPMPNKLERRQSYLNINQPVIVAFGKKSGSEAEQRSAGLLMNAFRNSVLSKERKVDIAPVRIEIDNTQELPEGKEAYRLEISKTGIRIQAQEAGLFYAVQTLLQLIPDNVLAEYNIPCLLIEDYPKFSYRGLHFDVSRHFFGTDFVMQLLDQMAAYKLNNFHWHLTDDQGWRIEIKKYPKLTQIGAYRKQTLVGNYHDRYPQFFDGQKYGGYYTQEEIKKVIDYAQKKYINIVPEIDMPGHTLAALASYPYLACQPKDFEVAEKWGVFEDVLCPSKDSTFVFVCDVLNEVMNLFPSKSIHIGGDECPKDRWNMCPSCATLMKTQKMKSADELQSYFIKKVQTFVSSKGRTIIGWDEIQEGGLAKDAVVMSWRGTKGAVAAVKQKNYAIFTPMDCLYFDHSEGVSNQEPLTIGGLTSLNEVYSFNPESLGIQAKESKYVLGVQANIWTEYMATKNKVNYMLFPRLLALSEVAWTLPKSKNHQSFSTQRVPTHLSRMDKKGIVFRVPKVFGVSDTTMLGNEFKFVLKPSVSNAKVLYTTDEYKPDATSEEYKDTLTIRVPEGEYRVLKTMVVTASGLRSAVSSTYLKNMPMKKAYVFSSTTNDSISVLKTGLRYNCYQGRFSSVKDLCLVPSIASGVTTEVVRVSKLKKSLPKNFGVNFLGFINLSESGNYVLSTQSHDGSVIWIDDELVVDNDGRHSFSEAYGAVPLEAGYHKIKISYFESGVGAALKCYMNKVNMPKQELSASMFYCQ